MTESVASDAVTIRELSEDLLLIEAGGRRIVTEAACPHRKGRLRFGYLNARTLRLTCPLHHSSFDLLTGEPVAGPACRALRVLELDDRPSLATER
jgi:nitrite reductase (NADH) small subunit